MHPLLEYLNAAVSVDQAPCGVRGRVSVGVIDGGWWTVELGDVARARFHDEPPREDASSAVLIMGEAEAEAILSGQPVRAGGFLGARGDRKLLQRFADRYLRRTSHLGFRIQHAKEARKR